MGLFFTSLSGSDPMSFPRLVYRRWTRGSLLEHACFTSGCTTEDIAQPLDPEKEVGPMSPCPWQDVVLNLNAGNQSWPEPRIRKWLWHPNPFSGSYICSLSFSSGPVSWREWSRYPKQDSAHQSLTLESTVAAAHCRRSSSDPSSW